MESSLLKSRRKRLTWLCNSFAEFLEEYTKLGCIGGEDWQWEVFTNNHTTPIDSTCENAKKVA